NGIHLRCSSQYGRKLSRARRRTGARPLRSCACVPGLDRQFTSLGVGMKRFLSGWMSALACAISFAATAQVAAAATADLSIPNDDGVSAATPGGSVTYTITASNLGSDDAPGTTIGDTFPAALTCGWSCVGTAGGTCKASGFGNINDTVDLPNGASV